MRYCVNSPQVINEMIDGEAIMINLATGSYYSLDRVGGDVWALIEASLPVGDIVEEIGRRYDGAEEDVRSGVEDLIERLTAEGLVAPCGDDGSAEQVRPATTAGRREPFRAPRLEKFTDMQDLILLDPVHEVDSRGWPHLPDRPSGQ